MNSLILIAGVSVFLASCDKGVKCGAEEVKEVVYKIAENEYNLLESGTEGGWKFNLSQIRTQNHDSNTGKYLCAGTLNSGAVNRF